MVASRDMIVEQNCERQIVAVIRRNVQGQLERCDESPLDCGASLILVPVLSGLVVVIGPIHETEYSMLEILLKDL